MSNDPPVSLLDRSRGPQETDAWNRFVELYTPLIYFWGKKLGVQTSDISDFVQVVFAVLVRELPRLQYRTGVRFRG
jgi:RNA polymerase sigma-70 factor, ECF subfamily